MLCFDLVSDTSLKVPLCDEMVRYSAYKEDGVHLALTLAVCPQQPGNNYLKIIHPRALTNLQIVKIADWDSYTHDFPYGFIFRNVIKQRLKSISTNDAILKCQLQELSNKELNIKLAGDNLVISDELDLRDDLRDGAPFNCYKIGPFTDKDTTYLFRLECDLTPSSFEDLIDEDTNSNTRIYRVYGADFLHTYLRDVCIPKTVRVKPEYVSCQKYFKGIDFKNKRIIPDEYCVTAIDNPNCNPFRMESLDLTDDFLDISSKINPDLFEEETLTNINGRIHLYVTKQPTIKFYLRLRGPISLSPKKEINYV